MVRLTFLRDARRAADQSMAQEAFGLVEPLLDCFDGVAPTRGRGHVRAGPDGSVPQEHLADLKAMLHSVYDQANAKAVHVQFDKLLDLHVHSEPPDQELHR